MQIKTMAKNTLNKLVIGFNSLRIKTDHSTLIAFIALLLILVTAFSIRLLPLHWEIQTGSLHLSEFDPYFQFRFTEYIINNGPFSWATPTQWVDFQRWYPGGINIATAGFPGLPLLTAFLYSATSALGFTISLMDFAALFAPVMGMLTCLALFFLGKFVGGTSVGLLASLFLALNPSHIQRTSVGFFDDETIGIISLVLFALFFLKSIEIKKSIRSTMKWSILSGLVLGYFCSGWGAAYYPIGLICLFVVALIFLKRYDQRILLSYSISFGLGLFIAINVPKLSTNYLITSAILPVAGVFSLLCLNEVFCYLKSSKSKIIVSILFALLMVSAFAFLFGNSQDIAGKFWSVINPFLRGGSPLIESVAEHKMSAWGSLYYDFGVSIIFFLLSLFFVFKDLNNNNLFLLLFGLTSLYFATSMVRLLMIFAPAFSILAAIGIIKLLIPFKTLLGKSESSRKTRFRSVGKEFSGGAIFLIFLILMTNLVFPMPNVYRQAFTPVTVTAASLPILTSTPVTEWVDMLQWTNQNLQSTNVVCAWWDYGYWLTVLGNVTTLADNATINTTQIQNIGFIFMANETQSLEMLNEYDAEYILVFSTFDTYGNWINMGDEGKWMWMARISGQANERFVEDGYINEQDSWTDETVFGEYNSTYNRFIWNEKGMDSTFYRLSSWAKHEWTLRNQVGDPEEAIWIELGLSSEDIKPKYFEEVYFSGLTLDASSAAKYGNVVPLVCLYKINWDNYLDQ